MSIYATLWTLMFPRHGDWHTGCEWVEVIAQGVPAHIGTPTPGHGYEDGDPYAAFLPPPIPMPPPDVFRLRAVVIVTADSPKVVQAYVAPLLVLTGDEYERVSFDKLHQKICDALRGGRPRCMGEIVEPGGRVRLVYEDGSTREGDAAGD